MLVFELFESTVGPAVGLLGVGVDSGDDDLLTVAQKLHFLPLAFVRRDQVDGDLLERLFAAEGAREFWRLADADERVPVALAYELLTGFCRGRVEDVDVERRHAPSQAAGIGRVGPRL